MNDFIKIVENSFRPVLTSDIDLAIFPEELRDDGAIFRTSVKLIHRDFEIRKPHITFSFNEFMRLIQCTDLDVPIYLQKRGYGRILVEGLERFAQDVGASYVRTISINDSFWTYMGYSPEGEYLQKTFR